MEPNPSPAAKKSVRYEVRSEGGVLMYETLFHVEQAYLAGWIDPNDEIRQEGDATWKKASEMPKLATLQKMEKSLAGAYVPWIIAGTVLGVASLIFLLRGNWGVASVLAVMVSAILIKLNTKAATRRR